MSTRAFRIYNAINTGQIKKVLGWLDWADAAKIREQVETSVLVLELQHCFRQYVEEFVVALEKKFVAEGVRSPGLSAAAEKERWTALFYIKAYSVIRPDFKGALDILQVRQKLAGERLKFYDAESVLAAEETYFGEGMRLLQGQAMAWDEYMSMSYMSCVLVREMLLFRMQETPEKREKRYGGLLGRPLTEKEAAILKGYALNRAEAFLDWLKEYVAYLGYMRSEPDRRIGGILLEYEEELFKNRRLPSADFRRLCALVREALSMRGGEAD